jgi:hypothetical protein
MRLSRARPAGRPPCGGGARSVQGWAVARAWITLRSSAARPSEAYQAQAQLGHTHLVPVRQNRLPSMRAAAQSSAASHCKLGMHALLHALTQTCSALASSIPRALLCLISVNNQQPTSQGLGAARPSTRVSLLALELSACGSRACFVGHRLPSALGPESHSAPGVDALAGQGHTGRTGQGCQGQVLVRRAATSQRLGLLPQQYAAHND